MLYLLSQISFGTSPTQGIYIMVNLESFPLIIMEEAESFGQKEVY